uniref:Uncharacterized protein n=1 Tax=Ananas comosus var. bracteatus TaxID=296719 RepID=A0A6V7Q0P5_ANACO|nr:unnamed protein product [Ananas comosus var. bracteatus]
MSVIQLSYTRLLDEIAEKLGVETPKCVVTIAAEVAKEDAARVAIQRMKDELGLQIKDTNYDDFILYKSLYDNVTVQNSDLLAQFTNLKREHNLLKDCYATAVSEKVDAITEQVKMHREINDCHETINCLRADRAATATGPSEAGSAS